MVAVDGFTDGTPLADIDGELAGYIAAEIDEAPRVFDRPDRLFICDIYVDEPYRGTGLAEDLFDRLDTGHTTPGVKSSVSIRMSTTTDPRPHENSGSNRRSVIW